MNAASEPWAYDDDGTLRFGDFSFGIDGPYSLTFVPTFYTATPNDHYYGQVYFGLQIASADCFVEARDSLHLDQFRALADFSEANKGKIAATWTAESETFAIRLEPVDRKGDAVRATVTARGPAYPRPGDNRHEFTATFALRPADLFGLREGVVTMLQLIARNPPDPDAPKRVLRYRDATVADAEALSAIVTPLAEKWIACDFDEQGRAALLGSMTVDATRERLASERYRHRVATFEGRIIGVIAMRDDNHLYWLFIDDEYKGRKLARHLWESVKHEAATCGVRRFTVNSSLYAVPVYRAFGFGETGEQETQNGVTSQPMALDVR
jgi:GNAT superfamily N-acetyltransferase